MRAKFVTDLGNKCSCLSGTYLHPSLQLEDSLQSEKERQKEHLRKQLADRRAKKKAALRFQHEQLALENNLKLADVGTNGADEELALGRIIRVI